MFTDGRSKRVVFLAHCLLNQNSISDGTAVYPAAFKDVIRVFLDADVGIVQMPCPELCCLGLDRGDPMGAQRDVVCENTKIDEYTKHGFHILGIVGANRSPNCGVDSTTEHDAEVPGMGAFMEEISSRLSAKGIQIPMVGLKGADNAAEKMKALLRE